MKMNRIFSVFLSLLIISSSGCLSGEVDEFYGEDISPPISVDDFVLDDEAQRLADEAAASSMCIPIGEGENCW